MQGSVQTLMLWKIKAATLLCDLLNSKKGYFKGMKFWGIKFGRF